MSAPIHFKGTDYASVEAMPPEVREAYEKIKRGMAQIKRGMDQARRGLEQTQSGVDEAQRGAPEAGLPSDAGGARGARNNGPDGTNAPGAEALTPAWGGPRAPGSVPVPVEFDPVVSLGPATGVFEHDGVRLFPNFGPPHPNGLVVYRDGFAFRAGKDMHTWRWEEVTVIQSNLYRNSTGHGRGYIEHEYTLTKNSGDKVILDSGIKNVEGALEPIKHNVFAQLLPPLAQAYQSGQAVTFGPVTIHKQNGIQMDGKPYAWETILEIKVHLGRFTMSRRDGKKHEVRASAIPNIELLCQMIGLKIYEPELGYF